MNKIFVSYRRNETSTMVGRIVDRLELRYGKRNIFRDLDSIGYGEDFEESISSALKECDVLLAIIGRNWASVSNEAGRPRLHDEKDWVRYEVSCALMQGVHVVPVLVEDAVMPSQALLPECLKDITKRNAAKVRVDPDFNRDITSLCSSIDTKLTTGPIHIATDQSSPVSTLSAALHEVLEIQSELSRISTLVNRYSKGETIEGFIVDNDIKPLTAVYENLNAKRGLIGDEFYDALSSKAYILIELVNARNNPIKMKNGREAWLIQSRKVDRLIESR